MKNTDTNVHSGHDGDPRIRFTLPPEITKSTGEKNMKQ